MKGSNILISKGEDKSNVETDFSITNFFGNDKSNQIYCL